MEPPIICYEVDGGDVEIFSSAEDAVGYLEFDYLDSNDKFYDSQGRRLDFACDDKLGITFHAIEQTPSHQVELRVVLADYFLRVFEQCEQSGGSGLNAIGCSRDEIATLSLPQLIDIAEEFVYQPPKTKWWQWWIR